MKNSHFLIVTVLAMILAALAILNQGCGFIEKSFEAVSALGDDGAKATRAIKNHMYKDDQKQFSKQY